MSDVLFFTHWNSIPGKPEFKTINGNSIFGSGDISISGSVWGSITGDIVDQADLQGAINEKLSLAGGTMSGELDMGGQHIDNISAVYVYDDVLDDYFPIAFSNGVLIANFELMAKANHTHGNITNVGAIGSTSGLPVITTTSGVLTTGTLTGTGTVLVAATSPILVTPNIGVATGSSLSLSNNGTSHQLFLKDTTGSGYETRFWQATNYNYLSYYFNSVFQRYSGVIRGDLGAWSIGHGGNPQAQIDVRPYAASWVGQIIRLAASQTADAIQVQNNSASVLAKIDASGNISTVGVAKFTGYPTSLLPAAASNAGAITYDTDLTKLVGCNGSTWNALW